MIADKYFSKPAFVVSYLGGGVIKKYVAFGKLVFMYSQNIKKYLI